MLLLHDNASTLRGLTCLILWLIYCSFQEIIVYNIPPGGRGVYSQPKVYYGIPWTFLLTFSAFPDINKFGQGSIKRQSIYNAMFGIYSTGPCYTVLIQSFRTDTPWQTVQTQIRLLLEEQSDQGLHCLPFRLHLLDSLLYGRAT